MHHVARTLSTMITLGLAATALTEPTARKFTVLLVATLVACVVAEQFLMAR